MSDQRPLEKVTAPATRNRVAPLLLGLIFFALSATVLAQLPPPPPVPPLPPLPGLPGTPSSSGPGSKAIPDIEKASPKELDDYVQDGFKDVQPGQPPYGLDTDGKPLWPIEKKYPNGLASAAESPSSANDMGNPAVGGNWSADTCAGRMAELPARGSFQPTTVRGLIKRDLPAGSGGAGAGNTRPEMLSPEEVRRLRFSFLFDIERFARFEFEGSWEKALGLALKWKVLGRRHASQIDEITNQIAQKQGQGIFSTWIAGVVTRVQARLPAR